LTRLFQDASPADHESLLEQFLATQKATRVEFDLAIRARAHMRKTAEPLLREQLTEPRVREHFNAMYGERVKVRFIQVANMHEVAEARRRIDAGEAFEQVAREMSRNAETAQSGGDLPPFSR